MAMDGSEQDDCSLRNTLAVPDPLSLIGVPGKSDVTWSGIGEIPATVSQGWKLYVSATLANYIKTLKIVGPILHGFGIPFKYLSSLSRVRDQNAGLFGFSQVGKCIVAYLYDESKVSMVLPELRSSLEMVGHEGPFVPRLPAAWSGASVFYRYGSYRGKSLEIAGATLKDDRRDPLTAINLIEVNPFAPVDDIIANGEKGRATHGNRSILAKFPVVSAICRSGKGGVFRGIDIQDPARGDVIVKIGLRLGSALPDGRDGAYFVGREWRMYGVMRDSGLSDVLATPIAFSMEDDANVLVLEAIQGVDLAAHRAISVDDPSHLLAAIRLMRRVHRAGYALGDAKAANFIVRGVDLAIVDLESSSSLRGPRRALPSSFIVSGPPDMGLEGRDILHFLISVASPTGGGVEGLGASQSRHIRLPRFVDEVVPCDAWAREALRLLRLAMHAFEKGPSLREFDRLFV